ncbi:hypothetical protein [Viridibacillus arvi]|uniref:Uncharacterized protein n=1 Tax=Viridibacillus arvi TaxID=263475 RepID=A0A0M0LJW2_9BACL|nr:hypothetical protein [Viridibacillus arvi]KOO50973.1 hypothetical protein AMD00_00100 [Viridibacillus arvi]
MEMEILIGLISDWMYFMNYIDFMYLIIPILVSSMLLYIHLDDNCSWHQSTDDLVLDMKSNTSQVIVKWLPPILHWLVKCICTDQDNTEEHAF